MKCSRNTAGIVLGGINGAVDDGITIKTAKSFTHHAAGIFNVAIHTAVHHATIIDFAVYIISYQFCMLIIFSNLNSFVRKATNDATASRAITNIHRIIVHDEVLDNRIAYFTEQSSISIMRNRLTIANNVTAPVENDTPMISLVITALICFAFSKRVATGSRNREGMVT